MIQPPVMIYQLRCHPPSLGLLAVALSLLLVATTGCSGTGDGGAKDVSRADVMLSLTDHVIVPGYRDAADRAEELRLSIKTLCAAPDSTALETARQHWRAARSSWAATAAFRVGPAMERRSASLVDWWPVDTERIDEVLDDGDAVSVERVVQFMAATQRGLGAIEYLLFGDAVTDSSSFAPNSSRCQYLSALSSTVAVEVEGIHQDWQGNDQEPGYAGYFSGAGRVSLDPTTAEAEVVRGMVFLVRSIANMQLAPALGIDGETDPLAIPSGPTRHSREDLRRQLVGLSWMYRGAEGVEGALGIGHRVRQLSPETDQRMITAIEDCLASADGLTGSLESMVLKEPGQVMAVYERLKTLQTVLNTEIVSLLGVTVGFSDTDGDS